ncbi:hypothetical protein, partial [Halomonas piscis]|uniref:hypothetical protein n=1 Tax=Halomonas piscis TaxID=3031727 RepID=UPI0028990F26
LSHDQTLRFQSYSPLSGPNLAQGIKRLKRDPKVSDESLALMIGDLSPTQASAHMNYLINLLKS